MLTVAHWILRRGARSPALWLVAGLGTAAWIGILVVTPLGLTTSGGSAQGALAGLLLACLVTGHIFGLIGLESLGWLFEAAAPHRRLLAEAAALGTAGLLGVLAPAVLAALLAGAWPAAVVPGLLLAHLHLTALGLVLRRLRPAGLPAWTLLPLLGWLLPALLRPTRGGPLLGHVLDVTRHLQPFSPGPDPAPGPQWAWGFLPIIGLIGMASLLAQSPGHALRDPR